MKKININTIILTIVAVIIVIGVYGAIIPSTQDAGNDLVNRTSSVTYSTCLQESANTTDQSGTDGICDLNYTGSYYATGTWNTSTSWDGDHTSDTYCDVMPCSVFVNYSLPPDYSNNDMIVSVTGSVDTQNLTIPANCSNLEENKLQLEFRVYSTGGFPPVLSLILCNNGSLEQNATPAGTAHFLRYFGEEAIIWNIETIVDTSTPNPLGGLFSGTSGVVFVIIIAGMFFMIVKRIILKEEN